MTEGAIVHDYFVQDGGAERVVVELADLMPSAQIYTTFFERDTFGGRIDPLRVHTWPLDGRVDGRHFRRLLPLYPFYFSTLDLRGAGLVVSSSSGFAKAVRTSKSGLHVAYIHTPMRFGWDLDGYVRGSSMGALARLGAKLARKPLTAWDRRTARGPDLLVANSETVRERIRRYWGRDADVIYPPVPVHEFRADQPDGGYLLVAARLIAHRRIDLAIAAAAGLGRDLVIVGDGPERAALERQAGSTVDFRGHVERHELIDLFEQCHAYLVPGDEDFGIAPVEAMAAGKPVVAFGSGGATETVVDGATGVLFEEQSGRAMMEAIERLDRLTLDRHAIRRRAEAFDRAHFLDAWRALFRRLGVDERLYTTEQAAEA